MNDLLFFMTCLLLLYVAGHSVLWLTTHYIARAENGALPELPQRAFLLGVWVTLCVAVLGAGLPGLLTPSQQVRALLVGAWCLALASLDLARFWLPFAFTAPMAVTGAVFSLVFISDRGASQLVAEGLCLFFPLLLIRLIASRLTGYEMFGLGDIWLITALVMWYPLQDVLSVTLLALLIALPAACRQRYLPFGPFLCLFAVLPAFISLQEVL
ncbi:MAG TPA: prepilin peptidase [Buttiauxella sp.]|jgi:prepilin signal peptidase PulO-like enzyme (type II secretory pathway)